jgi:hypothetical protein
MRGIERMEFMLARMAKRKFWLEGTGTGGGIVATRLRRSIDQPIREGLSWSERWRGPDNGLIWCWERGRQYRLEDPGRTARAQEGELVMGAWKGGVEKKLKAEKKSGTFQYLSTWQGMRGEDLDIELDGERVIVCANTGQAVVFTAKLPADEE